MKGYIQNIVSQIILISQTRLPRVPESIGTVIHQCEYKIENCPHRNKYVLYEEHQHKRKNDEC